MTEARPNHRKGCRSLAWFAWLVFTHLAVLILVGEIVVWTCLDARPFGTVDVKVRWDPTNTTSDQRLDDRLEVKRWRDQAKKAAE